MPRVARHADFGSFAQRQAAYIAARRYLTFSSRHDATKRLRFYLRSTRYVDAR